jgi:hypothetical protein
MKPPVAIALLAIAAIMVLAYFYFGTPTESETPPRLPIPEPTAEEQQLMMECGTDPVANDAACEKWSDMRVQRDLGALWTQPRDADWAEPMEQRLRQRLVKRLENNPVASLSIHCKTTVCRITAQGTTASSRAAFIEATDALIESRWGRKRLRFKASLSGDSQGDQWTHEFTLVRL